PHWSVLFLIGWAGMRGIVSLAAALALPLTTASGAALPFREEIILLTFAVIMSTLVLQGLSLAPLIRMLKLTDDGMLEREEAHARGQAATAALKRLEELDGEEWAVADHVERLRTQYAQRARRFAHPTADDPDCSKHGAEAYRRLQHETLSAERRAVIALRDEGVIRSEEHTSELQSRSDL